jgi:nucleotide-binding universal stress UspA family protein
MDSPTTVTIGSPLLLPFDGSANAEVVFPYVSLLVDSARDVDVILLQVIPEPHNVTSPMGDEMISTAEVRRLSETAARADLARAADRLAANGPGLRLEQIVATGDPWQPIADVATRCAARAILLSSQGSSATGPNSFGSVAGQVARTAPAPVVIVKPGSLDAPTDTVARLVVAHDGSERAERVLPLVRELAKRLSLPVHLVAVVEDEESALPAAVAAAIDPRLREEAQADAHNAARARVETAGASLLLAGVPASWEILTGPAAAAIMAVCASRDVLVISSHGAGESRWMLGSVAEKLVREAPVPVILLRTPPEQVPGQPPLQNDVD